MDLELVNVGKEFIIDTAQLEQLLEAIKALKPSHYTLFISSFLGIMAGISLEHFKRWLDKKAKDKEKKGKEVDLLGAALAAIAFNMTAIIHHAMQQFLPCLDEADTADKSIEAAKKISDLERVLN